MSANPIANIATLYNNPFLFAPIFETFYRELGAKEHSVLLSYLVLPLVLPQLPRVKLTRTTSLRTFTSESDRLYGLGTRIQEMKLITNLAVQCCLDQGRLLLDNGTGYLLAGSSSDQNYCPVDMIRAASKFGKICALHSVPAIYLQLGIKHL